MNAYWMQQVVAMDIKIMIITTQMDVTIILMVTIIVQVVLGAVDSVVEEIVVMVEIVVTIIRKLENKQYFED